MPPRSFPAVASDSCILALFIDPGKRLKAHRVLLLLCLPRSKVRNIESALRRLACCGALVELSSPSSAQRHPLYARSPTSTSLAHASSSASSAASPVDGIQATPVAEVQSACVSTTLVLPSACCTSPAAMTILHSQCIVLPADGSASAHEETKPPQPMCVVCRESWPTEVLLPCRHQACCKACWSGCVIRERSVHNKRERLKRELGARGHVRCVFRPRCPVCMIAVDEVISPYTNI